MMVPAMTEEQPPAAAPARPTSPSAGGRWVLADAIGTALFAVVVAVAIPLHDERPAQVAIAVLSMVLFAVGAVTGLWAYIAALERSRTDEIGVANLYLLTGPTAARPVKLRMAGLLVAQVVVALTGAIVGASGLQGSEVNALAFGILVPMFGIGLNGVWAVRHGTFGPRLDPTVQPSDRPID
jgi:hypothetical protein